MFRQVVAKSVQSCPRTTGTQSVSSSSSSRNITTLIKGNQQQPSNKFALFAKQSSSPSTKSSAINLGQRVRNATTSDTGAFLPDPERPRLGMTGITATVSFGLLLGATISKNIAAFLEENELFVPSDDDDDD